MIKIDKKYHAKVLLFGEYTIILGSSALSIPLRNYFGRWIRKNANSVHVEHLRKLSAYVEKETDLNIDGDLISSLLSTGDIEFSANIPVGYGMGSSGTVAAAFYDCFVVKEAVDLKELKSILASIECYYHGKSSGIDPLTSYLNLPLLFYPDGNIELIEEVLDLSGLNIYLLDSGMKRSTAPLVQKFMEQKENDPLFAEKVGLLCQYNNEIITRLTDGKKQDMFDLLNRLSKLQYEHMQSFIPEHVKSQWEKTLDSDDIAMKLCGAGGGGFYLLFSKQPLLKNYFTSELICINQ